MAQEHSLSRNCQISLLLLGHLTIYIGNAAQMMIVSEIFIRQVNKESRFFCAMVRVYVITSHIMSKE